MKFVTDFLPLNYFRERTSSQKLDWILNTPLILSSNVIWNTYRLIAQTGNFQGMDWQKSILQKDITYHISDNSVQINIKFTFTVIYIYINLLKLV